MPRSKAATYALLTLAELARRQAPSPSDDGNADRRGMRAGEISDALGLPSAYTAKILTQLTRAGILGSGRGPRGGFFLARGPREISLLEVVDAVDRLDRADRATESGALEIRRRIDAAFDRASARANEYLRSVMLSDLLENASSGAIGLSQGR